MNHIIISHLSSNHAFISLSDDDKYDNDNDNDDNKNSPIHPGRHCLNHEKNVHHDNDDYEDDNDNDIPHHKRQLIIEYASKDVTPSSLQTFNSYRTRRRYISISTP
jgi:hypothetical protein